MSYSVGEVAKFAGVTVRTLRHYDEIGLLSPSSRTVSGYRQYTDVDLELLQQLLFYRELGFRLEEIAAILSDPDADPTAHLRRQHRLLTDRIERLRDMAAAIELAMEAKSMGISLTPEERFEVFGDFDPESYTQEAEERWGDSAAYRESAHRAKKYTKADWQRIKTESENLLGRLVTAMEAGASADSPETVAMAEEGRRHIDRWFYPCSRDMHAKLAEMYMVDPRFRTYYDDQKEGLAQYWHDAISANAGN